VSARSLPIVCAWCERVRTSGGRWEEGDGQGPAASEATHGICPDCLDAVQHAAALEAAASAPLVTRARARLLS
jgi:hypothetical protein